MESSSSPDTYRFLFAHSRSPVPAPITDTPVVVAAQLNVQPHRLRHLGVERHRGRKGKTHGGGGVPGSNPGAPIEVFVAVMALSHIRVTASSQEMGG